jgi:hypothetical protein
VAWAALSAVVCGLSGVHPTRESIKRRMLGIFIAYGLLSKDNRLSFERAVEKLTFFSKGG